MLYVLQECHNVNHSPYLKTCVLNNVDDPILSRHRGREEVSTIYQGGVTRIYTVG